MSDEQLISAFFAYYSVGIIGALLWLIFRVMGRYHIRKYHPELIKTLPTIRGVARDMAVQILMWPLLVDNIIKQYRRSRAELEKCEEIKKRREK